MSQSGLQIILPQSRVPNNRLIVCFSEKPSLQRRINFPAKNPFSKIQKKNLAGKNYTLQKSVFYFENERGPCFFGISYLENSRNKSTVTISHSSIGSLLVNILPNLATFSNSKFLVMKVKFPGPKVINRWTICSSKKSILVLRNC